MVNISLLKHHATRIIVLMLSCLCALPGKAAIINYTPPVGEKISFTVLTTENFWENTVNYSEAESLLEAGGTKWKSFGFKYNGNGLISGLNMDLIGKIWNVSPIETKISTIAIPLNCEYPNNALNLTKIVLETSEYADFSECVSSVIETPFKDGRRVTVEFRIDQPKENLYYRINFLMTSVSSQNDWLKVEQVIGCESAIEVPVLTANAEKTEYSVVSTTGELHLLLAKYNSEGQLIEEIEAADQSTEAQAKVPAADDTSWKHKVGDVNENYTFTAPGENEYLALRAKTVAGTAQSAEIANFIRKDGVITGASQIVMTEESDNIRWFNMQGNEVTAPSKGIYIRVKSGKAEKIVF